jgi:hypothetical protein
MSSFESCVDIGPTRGESGPSARLAFDIADRELLPDLFTLVSVLLSSELSRH